MAEGGEEENELLPADSTFLKNTHRFQLSPCQYISGREIINFFRQFTTAPLLKNEKIRKLFLPLSSPSCQYLCPHPGPVFARPKWGNFSFVRACLPRMLQQVMWPWNGKRRLKLLITLSRASSTQLFSRTFLLVVCFVKTTVRLKRNTYLLQDRSVYCRISAQNALNVWSLFKCRSI